MRSFLTLLLTVCALNGHAQDLYNYDNSKSFAIHLFNGGKYTSAINELERLIYLNPDDEEVSLFLIKSYKFSSQYEKGINRAEQLYSSSIKSFPKPLSENYLQLILLGAKYHKFMPAIDQLILDQPLKMNYTLDFYLLTNDWANASQMLNQSSRESSFKLNSYKQLIERGTNPKLKSKGLAVVLSTLIPGMGKIYAGNYVDGILNFCVVGGALFQSYRGFSQNGISSPTGWIFGGLATGFYSGNIYGTAKAINRYNQAYWTQLSDDTKATVFSTY